MDERAEQFWQAYLATLPEGQRPTAYRTESWGDNPQLADELAALIVAGKRLQLARRCGSGRPRANPSPR